MDPMEKLEAWIERYPRLWRAYVYLNFCKNAYADGLPKPDSRLFKLFYKIFYLDCSCCSAIRGLVFGTLFGLALGEAIRWLT
jgi:hypothetical protein